jgi:hypothetical protein
MNKPQPNEDQKINANLSNPPQAKDQKKNQHLSHLINNPRPEIVEACIKSEHEKARKNQKPKLSIKGN